MTVEDRLRAALQDMIDAQRLPAECVHDAEPDYCDGCHYLMEKAQVVAIQKARTLLNCRYCASDVPLSADGRTHWIDGEGEIDCLAQKTP